MTVELKKEIWECPGEAHRLDMRFNPGSQGPYGDGFHDCDVCFGEYYISYREYKVERDYQERIRVRDLKRKEEERERLEKLRKEREQQRLIDKIMTLPKSNIL